MKRLAVLGCSVSCTWDNALKGAKEQPAMEYGAIDLHTRRSQIRIVEEDGTVVLDRRIDTTRGAFVLLFKDRAPLRILLEASTEAEWVA
jgi:hypothetical protein